MGEEERQEINAELMEISGNERAEGDGRKTRERERK